MPILQTVAGKCFLLSAVFALGAAVFTADCAQAESAFDEHLPSRTLAQTNSPAPATGTNITAPEISGSSTNSMETLDDKHKLAIGDRLSFRIIEDEEDPKPLLVTDSGDLEMPYIGRFKAEGKTCYQLARELRTEFEKDYYHHATVIVAVDVRAKTRGRIYLHGGVRVTGYQELPSDEVLTVSKAIIRAGGFTDFADKKKVRVTRLPKGSSTQGKTFEVNVHEILDKSKTEQDLELEPGDSIHVSERSIRF